MLKILLLSVLVSHSALAVLPSAKTLPRQMTAEERIIYPQYLESRTAVNALAGDLPLNGVRFLGEWEEADGIMALWPNPDLMRKYAERAKLHILADTEDDTHWWDSWLAKNQVRTENVSYEVVPTDTIWVRDYGPWWILDGAGKLGVVDPIYNRPRPLDDVVPAYFARKMGLPHFDLPLVHTGGNIYADGFGKAFSSTLVYSENPKKDPAEVDALMKTYLGINTYTTENLGKGSTIEHMDTFGKLVAPDTWVFAEFPVGSPYRADVDRMIRKVEALKSPYGTPYRIFHIPMVPGPEGDRAYINSFIHNRTLFYASYGSDAADEAARKAYQEALPDHEIVAVDAMNTEWGDSIHCRSRNIINTQATFIFPRVYPQEEGDKGSDVYVQIAPPPGRFVTAAHVFWQLNGRKQAPLEMLPDSPRDYHARIPKLERGSRVKLYVEISLSDGAVKRGPQHSPERLIEFEI